MAHDDVDSEDFAPKPPSPVDVARRALALATVTCRGLLELQPAESQPGALWSHIASWWDGLGLAGELEPHEAELLRAAFGTAPHQRRVDASWRSEALAVLSWALGRSALPPHDEQVDPAALLGALGVNQARTVLEGPELRPRAELEAYAASAFTVHWRLREFSLRAEPLDFRKFCETAWFGPLSLEGVTLVDGDLAVRGRAISSASWEEVRATMSIARERHAAANWLLDASLPLSETDTST
jgi:hypothetical protein